MVCAKMSIAPWPPVAIAGPAIARGKPLRSGGVTVALASAGIAPFHPRRGRLKVCSVSVAYERDAAA